MGVVRLSTTCPRTFTFTGATITSESVSKDDAYKGGVMGEDDAHEVEDERVGESEGGESDEPRKRLGAGGGRTIRISGGPVCVSSWVAVGAGAVFGRRPNSERVNARLAWDVPSERDDCLIIG